MLCENAFSLSFEIWSSFFLNRLFGFCHHFPNMVLNQQKLMSRWKYFIEFMIWTQQHIIIWIKVTHFQHLLPVLIQFCGNFFCSFLLLIIFTLIYAKNQNSLSTNCHKIRIHWMQWKGNLLSLWYVINTFYYSFVTVWWKHAAFNI